VLFVSNAEHCVCTMLWGVHGLKPHGLEKRRAVRACTDVRADHAAQAAWYQCTVGALETICGQHHRQGW